MQYRDRAEVGCGRDDTLGKQKPGRQLRSAPGSPHDHREPPAVEPDLERFLGRGAIGGQRLFGAAHARNVNGAEGGFRHCLETLTNPSGGSQAKDRVGVSSAGMNDALVVATRNIVD